jgi:FkbM family methyltransferase
MNPYFHEYDISTFIYDTLEEGDTIIDIGAMGGLYSIISSRIVGNKGKVISAEPNPDNLRFLQKNIELNNLHNITLVKKAIGEKNSKVTLYYDKESTELTSVFEGERRKNFETKMVTLDSLTEKVGFVKILKIDSEGCDERVLEGGRKTLQKTHYCIVETNNEIIRASLSQLGFNCEIMHPSAYLLATRTIGSARYRYRT